MPHRLTSTIRRKASRSMSTARVGGGAMPALFTTTSTTPCSASTSSTRARIRPSEVTSAWWALARPPPAVTAAAVSLAVPSSRSATATTVPRAARARAVARPIPEPPPVTIATFPDRSFIGHHPPGPGSQRSGDRWLRARERSLGQPAAGHPERERLTEEAADGPDQRPAGGDLGQGRLGGAQEGAAERREAGQRPGPHGPPRRTGHGRQERRVLQEADGGGRLLADGELGGVAAEGGVELGPGPGRFHDPDG